jgi:hypothetical protein
MRAEANILNASPKTQMNNIFILPNLLPSVYPNLTVSPTKSRVIGPPMALYLAYI